jgi:hypothetical protein
MEVFKEHETVSRLTNDINRWMRYLMGVYYFCSVAPLDLGIVLMMSEHNLWLKLTIGLLLIVIIVNACYINHLQATVIKLAHGCYPTLNSMMANKPMSVRLKLKVLALIEKLTGPEIGMYCFDLFPFTNYAFALLIANMSSNLLMFIDVAKMDLSVSISQDIIDFV